MNAQSPNNESSHTYADSGVDVHAGEQAVALMKASVERATRPEVVGGFGGFAGLFDASLLNKYRRPLLATSTDGVGTKVVIAQRMDIHDTIGVDLVAMVVDDIVVCGAEPLYLTDYIATGKVEPERIAAIVAGIARGCELAGCALLGGETAEHPGLLHPNEYDVAGAGTGVVEADELLGAHRVQAGDVLIGLASSGLHSNGYSLARRVLLGQDPARIDARLHTHSSDFGRTLGEELLEPTRIYSLDCLSLLQHTTVHAFSHITGGGLAANIARVLPTDLAADVHRSTWQPGPIFAALAHCGVDAGELERTFNMGLGMVAVVPPDCVEPALSLLGDRLVPAWVCGEVRQRDDQESGDAEAKGGLGGAVSVRGPHWFGR